MKAKEYLGIVLHNDFKLSPPFDGVDFTANLPLHLLG